MKAFHFRLAQLQRLGQAEEEAQKRLLKDSLADLARAEQALSAANQHVDNWCIEVQHLEAHGMAVGSLQAHRRWLPHLQQIADRCLDEQRQAEEVAERQRESFRLARQKSKVMANLRDRQQGEHRWQEQLATQQEQDELAVMAWPRREQR